MEVNIIKNWKPDEQNKGFGYTIIQDESYIQEIRVADHIINYDSDKDGTCTITPILTNTISISQLELVRDVLEEIRKIRIGKNISHTDVNVIIKDIDVYMASKKHIATMNYLNPRVLYGICESIKDATGCKVYAKEGIDFATINFAVDTGFTIFTIAIPIPQEYEIRYYISYIVNEINKHKSMKN